ncbi:MAG: glycosyltransferase family 4 protein [Lentisphaeria bacterium]|nr:glycosyltransferase family 4 protein [Lentisphaeria bacterium]NQZ68850.1 glycosyltransferase family 4 protein [Lentisphaeria bacterium]
MKIVYLIAGTGSYYCGTCMRDYALVQGMREAGHSVEVLPMYLPLVLENDEMKDSPIYVGGINAYLQVKCALFRYTPLWFDRLFDQQWLLRKVAGKADMTSPKDLGKTSLEILRGEAGATRKSLKQLLRELVKLNPQVLCISNALLSGLAKSIKKALPDTRIIVSLHGEDTFLDSLPEPFKQECWSELKACIQHVDLFVPVSEYYKGIMQERLDMPDSKLIMVHNGIDLSGFDENKDLNNRENKLGFLTQLIYGKGLIDLVEAFIKLKKRQKIDGLSLAIAGARVPGSQKVIDEAQSLVQEAGLEADFSIQTNLTRNEKIEFLQSLKVLSVPATYGESFGLYVLEALAAGAAVVQPNHAAFPELIKATNGGLLYAPNDQDDHCEKLESIFLDDSMRCEMAGQGRRHVFQYFSQSAMTANFLKAIES